MPSPMPFGSVPRRKRTASNFLGPGPDLASSGSGSGSRARSSSVPAAAARVPIGHAATPATANLAEGWSSDGSLEDGYKIHVSMSGKKTPKADWNGQEFVLLTADPLRELKMQLTARRMFDGFDNDDLRIQVGQGEVPLAYLEFQVGQGEVPLAYLEFQVGQFLWPIGACRLSFLQLQRLYGHPAEEAIWRAALSKRNDWSFAVCPRMPVQLSRDTRLTKAGAQSDVLSLSS
eukprot:gene16174-22333_t